MKLEKFYENYICQCFMIKNPSKELNEKFGKNNFLVIFYSDGEAFSTYLKTIDYIYLAHYDFFYLFSKFRIDFASVMKKVKGIKQLRQKSVETNKYIEFIKNDNVYFVPLPMNQKVSFQILDKQLIHVRRLSERVLHRVLKKYNEENKLKPISIMNIIHFLKNGYGTNVDMGMIKFIDEYDENEYVPINFKNVSLGYVFKSKSLKKEFETIKEIEKLTEDFDQEIEFFETINNPISKLLKIKGAKKASDKSIYIKVSDLNKSGIKWKITDFLC